MYSCRCGSSGRPVAKKPVQMTLVTRRPAIPVGNIATSTPFPSGYYSYHQERSTLTLCSQSGSISQVTETMSSYGPEWKIPTKPKPRYRYHSRCDDYSNYPDSPSSASTSSSRCSDWRTDNDHNSFIYDNDYNSFIYDNDSTVSYTDDDSYRRDEGHDRRSTGGCRC